MNSGIEHIINLLGWRVDAVTVTPLAGGITNQNYRLDTGRETFVLRIGGKGTHLLGIDRGREHTCTAIAAQMGVGAEVIRFLASEDVLVTRFIVGTGLSPENAVQPGRLKRIVDSIKRYHTGPDFPGTFSPFETVRNYHRLALERGVDFPETLPKVFAELGQIEQA